MPTLPEFLSTCVTDRAVNGEESIYCVLVSDRYAIRLDKFTIADPRRL